ncbi:MAG: hypothetical protein ACFE96_17200 [Candidatus Hermodarchaeota archaeon]
MIIVLFANLIIVIFIHLASSEYRCPNCYSNNIIDHGEYLVCDDCGFEFTKDSLWSDIQEENRLSREDLEGFVDAFEKDFRDDQNQKRLVSSINKDLEDLQD